MNIELIREVVELMKSNDLAEFELEDQGFRLSVKRRSAAENSVVLATPPAVVAAPVAAPAAAAPAPAPAAASAAPATAAAEGPRLLEIKSPIVGTFYRAPSPDAEPFVSVGQQVEEDTVVAIIEAMKVMNEIKAEVRGIIRKVCVENATAVQYGQVLFLVEPA